MFFQFGIYSSLLLIFFVHGAVYAGLLFSKGLRNETRSDKWLGFFLLLCILYISPWMLGFGGWYDNQPYRDILFYVPMQQLFFIGPVIFFYVQSLLNPGFRFGKKQWLHFLPGILYLLYCVAAVITDKLVLKTYFFLADQADPDFDTWYQLAGFVSMLCYFLLSLRYYNLYRKMIVQVISYADLVLFKWVRNFLYAFLCMLLLRFLFYIGSFVPAFEALSYSGLWWLYFFFALIFYYIAITGYSNSVETQVPFRISLLEARKTQLLLGHHAGFQNGEETEETSYVDIETEDDVQSKLTDAPLLDEWMPKIRSWMQEQRKWEDPSLSLTRAARELQTTPAVISRVINQGFGQNFNDFVNAFRIEAVKQMLETGELKTQTLLGIAFDCGFNSKATFNRAFKKATGMSPKEWAGKVK